MADNLTAEEIEALRQALGGGVEASQADASGHVRHYDFRLPDKFSKDQMRALMHMHDSMTRGLTTTLSAHLRTTVEIDPPSVEQVTYGQFVGQLPQPAVLAVVELPPLEGSALIHLDATLAFPMIDRMLGGPGVGGKIDRALTEIEATVIRRVLTLVVEGWCETWRTVVDLRGRLDAIETNPLFVQVAAGNDIVLQISLEAHMGRQSGSVRMCMPFTTIEPVLGQIASRQWYQRLSHRETPGTREGLAARLGGVNVAIEVRLGSVQMRLRELLALMPGEILPLGNGCESATVMVNGQPKFAGRPGRTGARLGVEIVSRLSE